MILHRRRAAPLLLTCVAAALPALASPPPQHPFETILPWSIGRGSIEAGSGLTRRAGAHPPFFTRDPRYTRDEWRLSLVDVRLGLGAGGVVRLESGLQSFDERGGVSEAGVEDARVSFTYQLPVDRLGVALQFGVKLPNAPDDNRLGTDESDISMLGSVGMARSRWGWAAHAGFGILGNPTEAAVQDDVLLFGAAAWAGGGGAVPATWFVEAGGTAASRFSNDVRTARAGVLLLRRARVHVAVRRGLTSVSEDWGFEAGVTFLRGPGGGTTEPYLP